MQPARTVLFALAAVAAISGCNRDPVGERHLTVTGPRESVETFIAVQAARETPPSLTVRHLPEGRAEARLGLSPTVDADDVTRLTKAALDAGLGYELEIGS